MYHFRPAPRLRSALLSAVIAGAFILFAPAVVRAQVADTTAAGKFQLAQTYVRAGQIERALPLLEDLYAEQPDVFVFYDKLREAYENLKRYGDALRIIGDQIQRNPGNPIFLAEQARLLYLNNQEQEADAAWNAALATNPDDRNTYRVVYQSMYEARLLDRAIKVLEQGQARLGRKAGFDIELAYLYSLTGEHEKAFGSYLNMLAHDERRLNFVQSRLARFTGDSTTVRAGIAATEKAVQNMPGNKVYRELLVWLYEEAGEYRKALDTSRSLDKMGRDDGRALFTLARNAADAGAFDVAADAYADILSHYPDSRTAPEALFGTALMQEQWARKIGERAVDAQGIRQPAPHFDQAMAGYQAFMQKYPQHPYVAQALRHIGTLQEDVYHDVAAAEETLRQVLRRFPNDASAGDAEFELGRLALLRGDMDQARAAFQRVIDQPGTEDLADRARYELGLTYFYAGAFDQALALLQEVDQNTSSLVANDAIGLKVLLQENRGPDSLSTPLRRYAQAHLLVRQRHPDQAIDLLNKLLADYAARPIADDARFLKAQALRAAGRGAEAATAFAEIPMMYPTSYLADKSLFLAAETLEQDVGDENAAIQTYSKLLAQYSGSLYAAPARARIRALRGDGV